MHSVARIAAKNGGRFGLMGPRPVAFAVSIRGCATSVRPPTAAGTSGEPTVDKATSGTDAADVPPTATLDAAAAPTTAANDTSIETTDDSPYKRVRSREFDNTLVEAYSRKALEAEGRADRIEAEIWCEDSCHYPILARGKKNVYDYTDDIPKDVKPMYAYHPMQQREYFQMNRERHSRPWWKRILRWCARFAFVTVVFGGVEFCRIWLQQPQEVAAMRLQILEQSYGKVLELGAGHGLNIGSYPYPVHEVVMVDTNQQLLDKLHYRIPKTAYPKYTMALDRAEKLSQFSDGEFDTIVDMFGLCHYRDPVLALRQMQRVVKPTGTILLLEHGRSPYFPINWVLDYFSERHTTHTHGCLWNLPLREYFKEARLIVREIQQHHYGTTYYVIAHPEILDEKTMGQATVRNQLAVR